MRNFNNERFQKILLIISLLFFTLVLIIIVITPPASGYEMSIYGSYSPYLWVSLIFCLFFSLCIMFFSFKTNNSIFMIQGFVIILAIWFLLLMLPTIRGYFLYGRGSGDILVHIGMARSIVETGSLTEGNFYPVVHLLLAYFNFIGFSFEISSNILGAFSSISFILFIFVLARILLPKRNESFFILLFAIPLSFSSYHVLLSLPSIHSLFTIPLIIYCYEKIKTDRLLRKFILIATLLIFNLLFYHPVTIFFAMVMFIVYALVKKANIFLKITKDLQVTKIGYFILLSSILFFYWMTTQVRLVENIFLIFRNLFYFERATQLEHYGAVIGMTDLSMITWIRVIIFRYFPNLLLIIFGLFFLLLLIKKMKNSKVTEPELNYGAQFFVGLFIGIIFIIGYFIEFDPIRVSRYALLMVIVFLGLSFYQIYYISDTEKKGLKILCVIFMIILSSSIIGIFNIYAGEHMANPNPHLTQMEKKGFEWYVTNRDIEISFIGTGFNLRKFEIYILGYLEYKQNVTKWDSRPIPTHFGYYENETLSDTFGDEARYMVTTEFNKKAYLFFPEEARAKALQYLEEDFEKLHIDSTVNKLYENGEFNVWKVKGDNKTMDKFILA
jgi:hypothetical protein